MPPMPYISSMYCTALDVAGNAHDSDKDPGCGLEALPDLVRDLMAHGARLGDAVAAYEQCRVIAETRRMATAPGFTDELAESLCLLECRHAIAGYPKGGRS